MVIKNFSLKNTKIYGKLFIVLAKDKEEVY